MPRFKIPKKGQAKKTTTNCPPGQATKKADILKPSHSFSGLCSHCMNIPVVWFRCVFVEEQKQRNCTLHVGKYTIRMDAMALWKCVSTSSPHLGPTTRRWVHPKSVAKDERVKPRGIFAADFGEDLHPRRLTWILTPVEKDIIWIKLSFSGSILIFGFFQKGEHTSDLSPKFPNRFSKSKLIGIEVYFISIILQFSPHYRNLGVSSINNIIKDVIIGLHFSFHLPSFFYCSCVRTFHLLMCHPVTRVAKTHSKIFL